MIAAGRSDRGLVRSNNQDYFYISKDIDCPLFILADGMGGHSAGEKASRVAVNTSKNIFLKNKNKLKDDYEIKSLIKKAVDEANKKIIELSNSNRELEGMGTTLIICYIFNDKIYFGHIGDSRAYYIYNIDMMEKITEDHSLVNELLKKGEISLEEALHHPKKNLITRAVGVEEDVEVDIIKKEKIKEGKILICSDGLTNMVEESKILEIINTYSNIDDACMKLIDKAKRSGGKDNITVILVEL